MIIRIEDAPSIKNIKIDISFDGDNEQDITVSQGTHNLSIPNNKIQERELDLDETYEVQDTIIEKPEIPEIVRDVKVSDDMVNAQY